MLAEQHRQRLDSIVQQMEQNGEDQSAIQAVVDDFKGKYSTSSPSNPDVEQPSNNPLTGFLEHNQLTAPFAHPVKLVQDVGNYVTGLPEELGQKAQEGKILDILNPAGVAAKQIAGEMLSGAQGASQQQFEKALQDEDLADRHLQEGSYSQVPLDFAKNLAHTGLGLVGAFPLTQGIARAEAELEDPQSRLQGMGGLAGELSNLAIPFLPKALKAGAGKLGTALEENAVNRYQQSFRAPKRLEGLSRQVAQQSLDRGLYGTEGYFKKLAEDQMAQHGAELEAAYKSSGESLNPGDLAGPALDQLAQKRAAGGVQFDPALEAAAQELKQKLEQSGSQPVSEVWQQRRLLEQQAAKKGAYLPGVDPALTAKAEASAVAADALRGPLNKAAQNAPSPANPAEYSYYANLKKLVANRKAASPVGTLARLGKREIIANTLGHVVGLPYGTASVVGLIGDRILASNIYKTASSLLQYKLGQALKAGDFEGVQATYAKMGASQQELQHLRDAIQNPPALDVSAYQEPQLLPAEPRMQVPNRWGGEVPAEYPSQRLPIENAIAERAKLELPQVQEPDLGIYQEPQLAPQEPSIQTNAPNLYGDEIAANVLRDRMRSRTR